MSKTFEVTLWEKITHTVTVFAENEDDAYEAAIEAVSEDEDSGESQGFYSHTVTEIEDTAEAEPEVEHEGYETIKVLDSDGRYVVTASLAIFEDKMGRRYARITDRLYPVRNDHTVTMKEV